MLRWMLVALISMQAGFSQNAPAPLTTGQAALNSAIEAHQAGRYSEAISGYQAYLQEYPEAAEVRSNLGAALAHEGRFSEAVEQYRMALAAMPEQQGIRLNLGLAYYKMGNIRDAAREFDTVHNHLDAGDPNSQQVSLLLAECLMTEGEYGRVVQVLDPLAAADPDNQAVDYLLGTALLRQGDEQRGAWMIEHILRRGDTAEAHMLMAFTKLKANDPRPGLDEVNRAIELNPNLPEAYVLRGRLQYITSDVAGAEASFRKALELDPNAFEALVHMGVLMRKQGRTAEAQAMIDRAKLLRPQDIQVRYQFAMVSADEGNDHQAAELLETLLKDEPQYIEAHRSLSTIDFRLGRVEEGRKERKIAESLAAQIAARDQERGRSLRKGNQDQQQQAADNR